MYLLSSDFMKTEKVFAFICMF
uniref:Uncharacterized protein n=1 Tax=Anguilla anguilla TaxID=7936 RepID=A0A0E9W411_ANGAN